MSWNSDGGDPWRGKGSNQGPPDLDKLLEGFQKKVAQMVGKKSSGDGSVPAGPSNSFKLSLILLGLLVFLFIWFVSGLFIVRPPEESVVLRFGKYVETVGPGLHWIPRGIEKEYRVDVQRVESYSYDNVEMLTKDENIVLVSIAVQFRKSDPAAYLFNVDNPIESLRQATASSLRQVIGGTKLGTILTSGRSKVATEVEEQLKRLLDKYKTGLEITKVAMQPARAPDAVKAAFDDAIKAQEDEQRFIKKAEAYSKQVIPQAEGKSKRLLADAQAYSKQVVLNADGETARFRALLPQYEQTPEVTRERLYLAALEMILGKTAKIFLDDSGSGNNVFYLPLEQLLHRVASQRQLADKKIVEFKDIKTTAVKSDSNNPYYGTRARNYVSRSDYKGRGN